MEPYIKRELDRIQKMVEDLRRELERRDVQLGHRILFDEKRAGEVPSPGQGDADRVLRADGTWGAGASTSSGSNIGVGVGVHASSSAGLMTFRALTGSGGISVTLSGSSVVISGSVGSDSGGSSGSFGADALTFSYFAAGTEGTSFVVSLPAVLETTDYSIFMTNAGSTGSFGSQLPANAKTTGSFRVNVTAPPSAGDRFDFLVIETPGNQWNLISGSTGGGDITNATNLGSGSFLFASKSTSFLQFKSLYAGPGVTLSSDSSHVTISGDSNGSLGIFGTGYDGTLTFDGSSTVLGISPSTVGSTALKIGSVQQYILTRDIYCEDLTIDSGVLVFTDGYRVFVRGTLTLNGYVGQPGVQGTIGGGQVARTATVMGTRLAGHPASPSSVPGSSTAPFGASNSGGAAGTNGTAGNNGNPGQDGVCYKGGGGGGIGNGLGDASIAGGTVTVATAAGGSIDNIFQAITGRDVPMSTRYTAATGGGYGAGAGLTLVGWGGGGGSPVAVIAYRIVGSGVVTAAGGDGSPGNNTFAYATNGGGGGGGGGGSFAVVVIGTGAFPTVDVSGGTGAPGGVGSNTTGGKGGDGGPGLSKLFRMGA